MSYIDDEQLLASIDTLLAQLRDRLPLLYGVEEQAARLLERAAARIRVQEARLANLKAENRTLANAGVNELERREAAEARLARAEALLQEWRRTLKVGAMTDDKLDARTRAFLAERKGDA